MRFIDEVRIWVHSGNGGKGSASFRREKFIPYGGPDGGDGGNGGDVYFLADSSLNTLVKFRGKRDYRAGDGGAGSGRQKHGAYGEDLIIHVPVGTIVKNAETSEVITDLATDGQKVLIARGGMGGLGNTNFKSSTNQAPRYTRPPEEGVSLELDLELRLLADIALIGLPNAGKSTLISRISEARPKVADYPFTTLRPNLGVVELGDNSFVVADIPGLIEGASEGKGLGTKFLRHIERTRSFVHLVDCSWCLNPYEAYESYITVRMELEQYNPELINKREIVCLTKIDAMSDEDIEQFKEVFEQNLDKKILPISSVSGRNIDTLKEIMLQSLNQE